MKRPSAISDYNGHERPRAEHGTRSGYTHLGCRCSDCTRAERVYKRRYRERRRDQQQRAA